MLVCVVSEAQTMHKLLLIWRGLHCDCFLLSCAQYDCVEVENDNLKKKKLLTVCLSLGKPKKGRRKLF